MSLTNTPVASVIQMSVRRGKPPALLERVWLASEIFSAFLQWQLATTLTVGILVTVCWETGCKKYWTAEVVKTRTSHTKKSSSQYEAAVGGDRVDIRGYLTTMSDVLCHEILQTSQIHIHYVVIDFSNKCLLCPLLL